MKYILFINPWNIKLFINTLTLPVLCISESCIEIKINFEFYFHTFCGVSKGFMKALKASMKPFEAPQRGVKTEI